MHGIVSIFLTFSCTRFVSGSICIVCSVRILNPGHGQSDASFRGQMHFPSCVTRVCACSHKLITPKDSDSGVSLNFFGRLTSRLITVYQCFFQFYLFEKNRLITDYIRIRFSNVSEMEDIFLCF